VFSDNITIPAFFPEKSAIKNFGITKAYRQQMVGVLDGREVLSYNHIAMDYLAVRIMVPLSGLWTSSPLAEHIVPEQHEKKGG
jgi:hypothetical protein